MATQVVTFAFASDAESFTPTTGGQTTGSWQSADGTPSNGCLQFRIDGKNKTNANNTYSRTLTFEDMGVPASSTITAINTASCYTKCREWNVGSATGNQSDGVTLAPSGYSTVEIAAASSEFTATTAWAQQTGAGASSLSIPSATSCTVTWQADCSTGSNNGAYVTIGCDLITFTVVYDPAVTDTPITVDSSALALAGQAIVLAISVAVGAASLTLSGSGVGTSQSFGPGALAFSGQDVTLTEGTSGYTLPVDSASLALAGQSVGLIEGRVLAVDSATLALSGQSVGTNTAVAVSEGALALAGQSLGLNTAVAVGDGALSLAGQPVGLNSTVAVDEGALALSGQAVTLTQGTPIAVDSTALALAGQAVGLAPAVVVGEAALTLAGQDVTLTPGVSGYTLPVDSSALALSGQAVGLVEGQVLAVDATALALSGQSVGTHTAIAAGSTALALSGAEVGTSQLFGAGSLAFTGQDITLTLTTGYTLPVDVGALTLAGQDVNLWRGPWITVEPASWVLSGAEIGTSQSFGAGSLAFTGQDVTLTPGTVGSTTITVDSTALALSGQAVVGNIGATVVAGSLTLAGQNIGLVDGRWVDEGALTLTGRELTLIHPIGSYAVSVEKASLALAGQSVGFDLKLAVGSGALALSGSSVALNSPLVVDSAALTLTGQTVGLGLAILPTTDAFAFSGSNVGYKHEGTFTLAVDSAPLVLAGGEFTFRIEQVRALGGGTRRGDYSWWLRYEQDMLRREDERRRLEGAVEDEISALMRGEDAPQAESAAREYLRDLSALIAEAQARESEFQQFLDGLRLQQSEDELARLLKIDAAIRAHIRRMRDEEEFIQVLLMVA